jgi:cytochrome b561
METSNRRQFATWLVHWFTASLTLFVIFTSVPSTLGLVTRAFGTQWIQFHLSAGALVLIITVARLLIRRVRDRSKRRTERLWSRKIQNYLLVLCLILPVTGLLIFQQHPLMKPVLLFGLVPFMLEFDLEHSLHALILHMHTAFTYVLLGLLLVHIGIGLMPSAGAKSPLRRMFWPWG